MCARWHVGHLVKIPANTWKLLQRKWTILPCQKDEDIKEMFNMWSRVYCIQDVKSVKIADIWCLNNVFYFSVSNIFELYSIDKQLYLSLIHIYERPAIDNPLASIGLDQLVRGITQPEAPKDKKEKPKTEDTTKAEKTVSYTHLIMQI